MKLIIFNLKMNPKNETETEKIKPKNLKLIITYESALTTETEKTCNLKNVLKAIKYLKKIFLNFLSKNFTSLLFVYGNSTNSKNISEFLKEERIKKISFSFKK